VAGRFASVGKAVGADVGFKVAGTFTIVIVGIEVGAGVTLTIGAAVGGSVGTGLPCPTNDGVGGLSVGGVAGQTQTQELGDSDPVKALGPVVGAGAVVGVTNGASVGARVGLDVGISVGAAV
jgi:hypothetical protein